MNRLIKNIILFSGLLLFVSCDKQLSEPPANARVDGTAITDQKTALTALNGVYYRFANVNTDNVTDWTYNNVAGGLLAGTISYGVGQTPEEINNNASSSATPPLWNNSYNLLNAANGVINSVASVPDQKFTQNKKNEILAEARFLRAYAHFKLLTFFGEWKRLDSKNGVLLRDQLSTLSNIPKARSTVAQSYDYILQDLDFAIAQGSATQLSHYASKWAAMALKMRVLLQRGLPADMPTVITTANTIISSGPYQLEAKLVDLFRSKGLTSKEVMLGIKPQPSQELFYYIQSRTYYPGASSVYVASRRLKDLFIGDPRGAWMVGGLQALQAYAPDTYYFTKYIAEGGTTSQLSETSYVIRLTEVYLMQAEAIIRSGRPISEAKPLIKEVMSKGGVTDFSAIDNAATADELLTQYYYEVLRNFTGEDAIEWLTLIRLPFEKVKQLRPTITNENQFYFPVPQTELDMNPLFGLQNTGYAR